MNAPVLNESDDTALGKRACRQCGNALDAGDKFCRHCGVSASLPDKVAVPPHNARPVGSDAEDRWAWESPWLILSLLFLAIGPFAIPLLWRSRRFAIFWKNVLTIVVLVLTALLLWLLWIVVRQFIVPLRQIIEVFNT